MRISLFLVIVLAMILASCSTARKQSAQTESQVSAPSVAKREGPVINIEPISDTKEENLIQEKPAKKKNKKMTYYSAKRLCNGGEKKSGETKKMCIKRLLSKDANKGQ